MRREAHHVEKVIRVVEIRVGRGAFASGGILAALDGASRS